MLGAAIETLLTPVVERLGFELVDLEFKGGGGSSVLQVFIDGPNGITLDDCAMVSQHVSAILDVEDPIPGEYNLEISSPGLDRPLRREAHFEKYAGAEIKVKMRKGYVGKLRLKGILNGLDDSHVVLVVGDEELRLPMDKIESARLVPEL
ncbi:MAG: ribosome maturation factor RimP [Pseudomonadota bacterium]